MAQKHLYYKRRNVLPLTEKKAPEPMVKMGDHCKGCNYIERCESKIYDTKVEIPISIIPFLYKIFIYQAFRLDLISLKMNLIKPSN